MTAPDKEKTKKSCFVIAPIGAAGSDTRKRSDKVLRHIFRSALEENYTVTRADEIDEAGMITSQILRAVQDSHLVVADLTETNPNVLYELAVRHAIEKPVIHVIEPRLSKIPFDIAGFRTIEFDITDPDSIEIAVDKLRKFAAQAEAGKWGENPIKLANIMRPSKDDSPEMLLLKQAVEGISMISERLENLESSGRTGFYGDRQVVPGDIAQWWAARNRAWHQTLDPEILRRTMESVYKSVGVKNAQEFDRALQHVADFAIPQALRTAKKDVTENASKSAEVPKPDVRPAPADPPHAQKSQSAMPRPKPDSK
jgi:hypothetical protein